MKKYTYYILLFLLCFVMPCIGTSCSDHTEEVPIGWLEVGRPSIKVVQKTRSEITEKDIDYLVSITRDKVTVMSPIRFSSITESIPLSVGSSYVLLAESCSKTEAESLPTMYGSPRYAGTASFSIKANEKTTVNVNCSMANAAFQVVKDASFYYQEFNVTATVGGRTLTFNNEEQIGYFNVGDDGTTVLQYEVEAIDSEGRIGRGKGSVTLRARNLSKLCLKATSLGYVDISISYDDTFTPINTDIIITE